jgi:hypothetical protein
MLKPPAGGGVDTHVHMCNTACLQMLIPISMYMAGKENRGGG